MKETREAIISIEDALKLCAAKYILLGAQMDCDKNDSEVTKSDLTYSWNLVELL